MTALLESLAPNLESEVMDLGNVPLAMLRTLDTPVLHRAVRHVVEDAGYVRVCDQKLENGWSR
ncbi:hypothetical protein [Amycolatopsis rifamycinica]|uniref:ARID domain-containing protein n=1 Tax=Amycolatopsis rifamycinica TaxID=287986 RepID=A0A066UBQ4_9PSEU|nr:hypothetical protein [Amycolatopsis rifamycinica]KDN23292.1 hypothetical protein DV20_06130 [Amycolatopsis rifamycinica]